VTDQVTEPDADKGPAVRHWGWWLGGITALGVVIRVISVLGRPNRTPGGDGYYYFYGAKLLVHGKGFINPFLYFMTPGQPHVQTASWPPLFVFVMAIPQALGIDSYLAARLWLCVFGAGAIVVVAYAAREISGRRVALIAAFLVAVYPNIWMSTELGLSETMTPLLVGWILWMAYRFWKNPGVRTAIWMGVSLGVSMLGRDELSLLSVFIFVPLALLATTLTLRRRFELLGIGALCAVLVVAPWVGFNLSRFDKPVFISTGLGVTLASANCDATYSGSAAGSWSFECAQQAPVSKNADESVQSAEAQSYALHYINTHKRELPKVEAMRLGRAFGFFRPAQQIWADTYIETRPYHWAMTGLVMYYGLLVMSVGGTVLLRRRRIPTFPLWAVGLNVVVAALMTFGNTRYRTPFEVPLVIMASVFLEWAARQLFHRDRQQEVDDTADPMPPTASNREPVSVE